MRRKLSLPIFVYCLFFLLTFPSQTKQIVTDTLLLWYQSVIPSLFPSILFVQYFLLTQRSQNIPILFGIVVSITCGFPIGTLFVCDWVSKNRIHKNMAPLYCAFLNQFSTAFICSYVHQTLLNGKPCYFVIGYYGMNGLLFALFYLCSYRKKNKIDSDRQTSKETLLTNYVDQPLSQAILLSSELLIKLFGYMFLCNYFIAGIEMIPLFKNISVILAPFLEVTSGLSNYISVCKKEAFLPLIAAALGFGGCSGLLQVYPLLQKQGVSILAYFTDKLFLGTLLFILAFAMQLFI